MIVTPFDLDVDPLAGRDARGEGVHVTDVIHHLERAMGIPEPDHWEHAGGVGFLWEEAVSTAYRNQAVRSQEARRRDPRLVVPGELEWDGILLTPDDVATAHGEVWEFKFTWKGLAKAPPESVWRYMTQLKSYCYVLGMPVGRLICMYCNGDYKPMRPTPVGRKFEFTEQELADNWRMILNGARDMTGMAKKGDS